MEIERKFLVKEAPAELEEYPCRQIEQAYLCTDPVIRIRRQDHDYILTYKGEGLLRREEYNLPLKEESYHHLLQKADGNILTKKRYLIPAGSGYTAELDLFEGKFDGLRYVEVEFPTVDEAEHFCPPGWFGKEVTGDGRFQNSSLSRMSSGETAAFLRLAEESLNESV